VDEELVEVRELEFLKGFVEALFYVFGLVLRVP
jgi:hypothetical protein